MGEKMGEKLGENLLKHLNGNGWVVIRVKGNTGDMYWTQSSKSKQDVGCVRITLFFDADHPPSSVEVRDLNKQEEEALKSIVAIGDDND